MSMEDYMNPPNYGGEDSSENAQEERSALRESLTELSARLDRQEERTQQELSDLKTAFSMFVDRLTGLLGGEAGLENQPQPTTAKPIEPPETSSPQEAELPLAPPVESADLPPRAVPEPVPSPPEFPGLPDSPASKSDTEFPGIQEELSLESPSKSGTLGDIFDTAKEQVQQAWTSFSETATESFSGLSSEQSSKHPRATESPDARWQSILFGDDIEDNALLRRMRQELLAGLLAGEQHATTLAGHLLIFQAAPPDRLALLLKDLGEAFYRWNPSSGHNDPMRDALIVWIHQQCKEVGVSNTIVPVHVGDRFEASRHIAKKRGVEVTAVQGWVVLRDNGKVYTKAAVDVR